MPSKPPQTPHILQIDSILDSHRLYRRNGPRHWSKVHRHGKTKRWDSIPTAFHIPVKIGYLLNFDSLDESCFDAEGWLLPHWRVEA